MESPILNLWVPNFDLNVITKPKIFLLQISSHDNVSLDFLAPGDSVSLLCESDQSKPASDLSWAINGAQVMSNIVI